MVSDVSISGFSSRSFPDRDYAKLLRVIAVVSIDHIIRVQADRRKVAQDIKRKALLTMPSRLYQGARWTRTGTSHRESTKGAVQYRESGFGCSDQQSKPESGYEVQYKR
jgi:hypothetical protein